MAEKRVFAKGVHAIKPHPNAPAFIKASVIITLQDLMSWWEKEGTKYLDDYNGKQQLKLQITEWEGKFSIAVDTYKKPSSSSDATQNKPQDNTMVTDHDDDLPF